MTRPASARAASRNRLPYTHTGMRATMTILTAILVSALCWKAVSGGRGIRLAANEIAMVRWAWSHTIAILEAVWTWISHLG